ncbi:MAG: hypothetical protein QNJ81_01260 [Acidimicrobiia bacterium]|nr:hypothetical protein [Acidimicrobiia bacterium]
MNLFWLTNLSVAINGTRYLAGVDDMLRLSYVDRVVVDARPLGPQGMAPDAFVELLKTEGTIGVDLAWVGETSSLSGAACGFVLVPRPDLGTWRMHSTFTMGGPDHGWDSTFELFVVPEGTEGLSVPEASNALLELLRANDDHLDEFHRNAVHDSQKMLAGSAPCPSSLFGINIEAIEEDRARLLAASVGIAAGKLSGMGGFDDIQTPTARRFDPVTIVGQAIAASMTGP